MILDRLQPRSRLLVGGVFGGKVLRAGRVVDRFDVSNLVVNQGLDALLAIMFAGAAQTSTWYLALFGNNYVPVATDTAASIVSAAGEITNYTSSTRVAYGPVEANQQATNATAPAAFTFTSAASIYGAFLISSAAKSSTSGTLFAATQFSAPKNVASGDILQLTYTMTASSA